MTTPIIVWILTVLAAVVIVLTRLRLRGEEESGQFSVSGSLLLWHTISGVVALVVWVAFLLAPSDTVLGGAAVGIVAIAAWWVVAICGLLLLVRWLPSRGRHVPQSSGDSWSEGPGLSVLAHVGMTVGVVVFTYAYLSSLV